MTDHAEVAMPAVFPLKGNVGAFAAWAEVYDDQENPLTALEERYLPLLLPEVRGADVLDVGCGTGRWLSHLAPKLPHSLRGADASPEMLREAVRKSIPGAQLSLALCTALPASDETADLMLSSFVASYVNNLTEFARELFRVARRGSTVFVTDMHPETAARLDWKRGFRTGDSTVQVSSMQGTMQEILQAFREAGFSVRALLEPSFGEAERHIFAAQNKLEQFDEAAGLPVIYLLHLHKEDASLAPQGNGQRSLFLEGARCALGPREAVSASMHIQYGRIESLGSETLYTQQHGERITARVDLRGFLLLPGLINAHDHLEFALFPRLGNGTYRNATQWAHDIQANEAATIAMHKAVPRQTRLWWGGVRNLLSGATTVCHHNPMDDLLQNEAYPVRVLDRFGWEHSLGFARDIPSTLKQTHQDIPFILHACEGSDEQAASELRKLDELGVLEERTVLVHALALDEMGVELIKERGTSVIICPSSNEFLFGKVPSGELVRMLPKVALGSDSSLTAAGDLLDEIRFTSKACGLSAAYLYGLVTKEPALVLRLRHGVGTLQPAGHADLIAVRERPGDPAEILGSLTWREVELVLLGGRVQLASEEIFSRLSASDREGLEPLNVAGVMRWLRVPVAEILREAEAVLGEGTVQLGGLPIGRVGVHNHADVAQMGSRCSADAR
jgi:cytosine/adenosine deaminase-related metal-dependent hydrolase/ubiquinone/menaquinone biosynthesis C-methylase UbiE